MLSTGCPSHSGLRKTLIKSGHAISVLPEITRVLNFSRIHLRERLLVWHNYDCGERFRSKSISNAWPYEHIDSFVLFEN